MSKKKGLSDFVDHDAGSIVWNASLVLLNHLRTKNATDFKGKRVLELGSGIGHLVGGHRCVRVCVIVLKCVWFMCMRAALVYTACLHAWHTFIFADSKLTPPIHTRLSCRKAWGLYEMGAHVTASNTAMGGDLKELEQCVQQWKSEQRDGKVPEGVCVRACVCVCVRV